jgi:protein-disulfide isomerase
MKKKSKKLPFLAIAAAILVGFAALVVHNYKTRTSFKHNTQTAETAKTEQNSQDAVNAAVTNNAEAIAETRKNSEILKVSSSDIVYGDKSAPVVMIEYASLSCPHCAAFHHEAFDKMKAEYIDTKKVQFIHRSFPLNQPALSASMFANCQANTSNKEDVAEKYYSLIKALFKTQDSWAFDAKYL